MLELMLESFVVGLSGAMAPGPLAAAVMVRTLNMGWVAGPLAAIGHALLEAVLVLALLAGLVQMPTTSIAQAAIFALGGVVLMLMGALQLRGSLIAGTMSTTGIPFVAEDGSEPIKHPRSVGTPYGAAVLDGIVASVSNPYWFLWWLTIGSAYLMRSKPLGAAAPGAFWFGHIMSDMLWFTFLAVLTQTGKNWAGARFRQLLAIFLSILIILLGGGFLRTGILEFVSK